MPVLEIDNTPEQDPGMPVTPGGAGTLSFYREGLAKTSGLQLTTEGATVSSGKLLGAEFGPADHGFETWTHDMYGTASSVIAVNGRIYAIKLPVRRSCSVLAQWWSIATAGVTPTAGQNWIGLYSSAGVRLAQTAADANVTGSGGQRTALATPQGLVPATDSFIWQLFLFNAGTAPTLVRGSSFEGTPNINLTASTLRAAVVSSGQTTLPASFDPATLSTTNCLTFWAALEVST